MHLSALPADTLQRPSRKGKERDMLHRDPQPTDIDEKILAFRRRNAGSVSFFFVRALGLLFYSSPPRSRGKPERDRERERPQAPQLPPASSTSRADRSLGLLPTAAALKSTPVSPRRSTRVADADHEEFSRRLKISNPPTPRPPLSHAKPAASSKLFNPDTDPIPMRRTTEPESVADGLFVPRPSGSAATPHRDDRAGPQRQLFDHRKDDPVKFSASARSPQPSQPRLSQATRSSGDHVSAASTSSYAPSVASSLTLSSTTDSSASSALFDTSSQTHEQTSSNAFSMQLKLLYREITSLENQIKQEDAQDDADDSLEGRVLIRGKEIENFELEKEKWKRRLADHKKCVPSYYPF